KFIMHGEGWFPYYSWVLKSLTYPFVYITRKIAKKIGIINNNQGPWSEWDELIQSEKWEKMIEEYKVGSSQFEDIFKQDINILFNFIIEILSNNQTNVNGNFGKLSVGFYS